MSIDSTDPAVIASLQRIVELEMGGVVRFAHYALMVTGPHRLPIVDFLNAQALESLQHAQRAGEILTGLGGHPAMGIAPLEESNQHSVSVILDESYAHEQTAIQAYRGLLELVEGKSVFLEEYARSMVAAEEEHCIELGKMRRDLGE